MALISFSLPGKVGAEDALEELIKATKAGDSETVAREVARGMHVDSADRDGNTLLMLASREGHLDLVQNLVKRRARVRAGNGFGETPLMLASLKGHLNIVKFLLANGAEINHQGWTPLHYCATEGKTEVCQYLLEKGADIDAPSPNGTTSLMMAARFGHFATVKLLVWEVADLELKNDTGQTALSYALYSKNEEIIDLLRQAGARR